MSSAITDLIAAARDQSRGGTPADEDHWGELADAAEKELAVVTRDLERAEGLLLFGDGPRIDLEALRKALTDTVATYNRFAAPADLHDWSVERVREARSLLAQLEGADEVLPCAKCGSTEVENGVCPVCSRKMFEGAKEQADLLADADASLKLDQLLGAKGPPTLLGDGWDYSTPKLEGAKAAEERRIVDEMMAERPKPEVRKAGAKGRPCPCSTSQHRDDCLVTAGGRFPDLAAPKPEAQTCPNCSGAGYVCSPFSADSEERRCPDCNGTGKVEALLAPTLEEGER